MPDRFGKKCGPSWRTWSYLAGDFAGVAHPALKQAMKTVEKERQPIAAQDIIDFGATMELDQELATFPWSRGQRVEPSKQSAGLKGSQAWSNGEDWPPCTTHWAAGRQFRRQQANPFPRQKLLSWKTCLTLFKHEKTLEQRPSRAHRRQVAQGYETCDAPGKRSRQHGNTCSRTSNKCVRIL